MRGLELSLSPCRSSVTQCPGLAACGSAGLALFLTAGLGRLSLVQAVSPVNSSRSLETLSAQFFFPSARWGLGHRYGSWGQWVGQREHPPVPSRHTGPSSQGHADPLQMRVRAHAKLSTVKEPATTRTTTGREFLTRHAYARLEWSCFLRSTISPPRR